MGTEWPNEHLGPAKELRVRRPALGEAPHRYTLKRPAVGPTDRRLADDHSLQIKLVHRLHSMNAHE